MYQVTTALPLLPAVADARELLEHTQVRGGKHNPPPLPQVLENEVSEVTGTAGTAGTAETHVPQNKVLRGKSVMCLAENT
jgi:hypothetical protein